MSSVSRRPARSLRPALAAAIAVLAAFGSGWPATALETSLQYVLTLSGDIERRQVEYRCEERGALLEVEYVNAAPNFLAILAVEAGEPLIFANVVSASGARYASGSYVWWTKGAEAGLFDALVADPDEPPILSCFEFDNIP